MIHPPTTTEQDTAVPPLPLYRLSVAQYHAMIDAGVLTEDDPIELLEGCLVTKMPKNRPHSLTTQTLRDLLPQLLPVGYFVEDQEPVTTEDSEPEPDMMVIRGRRRDYPAEPPKPENVALIVEVADSTLHRDRTVKKRLYAAAEIPVYWIINLVNNQIEVYTEPIGTGRKATYQQEQVYGVEDEVPVVVDGRTLTTIPTKEILP